MRDRISLRDHIVEVEIGAFQAERGTTQRICFNVVVEVQPITGPVDDDVDRILSYDKVTEAIAAELADERLNLLETLSERVAERILVEPQAMRVFVRVEKLDRGPGALGVEIVREKQASFRVVEADAEEIAPKLVFLSNEAIASPNLRNWLDQLSASEGAIILCVGNGDAVAPISSVPLVQRRIDLLAIEQNAWVLAGHDARCVVVGTQTELDWGMRNSQISVWAPSKMVLDAVDGPDSGISDGLSLMLWLAERLGAKDQVSIGEHFKGVNFIPSDQLAI
jgi:dihydroneopterin aldolase